MKCPACAEEVAFGALVCRFCRFDLVQGTRSPGIWAFVRVLAVLGLVAFVSFPVTGSALAVYAGVALLVVAVLVRVVAP